jgi:hypothetical protein
MYDIMVRVNEYNIYHQFFLLQRIFYEVQLCDFHHIDGDLLLVPWSYWTDLEGFIFMKPFLFMALDHLMEVFGWGSLTSPWLDDCACCFVVFSHVLSLLITPWLYLLVS